MTSGIDLSTAKEARSKVQAKVDRYERKRERIRAPEKGESRYVLGMALLLPVSAAIMFAWPQALVLWVIVTFLLYSFNYLVFFLPITRYKGRRKREPLKPKGPIRDPIISLLGKPAFLVEVGATMFLVGMVPLARSFFLLFGIGLAFTIYHGVLLSDLPAQLTAGLIIQILVIMAYFLVVVAVSPQSQGFTKLARSLKFRVLFARAESRWAYILAMTLSGTIIVAISLIAVGAVLLPGLTVGSLMSFAGGTDAVQVLAAAVILAAEFFVMRVPQSSGSRRMALDLLDEKTETLTTCCLRPMDALIADAEGTGVARVDRRSLDEALYAYYPVAIYNIVETNLFGRLPVYLVAPDVDMLLDTEALRYVGVPRGLDGRPILDDRSNVET